MRIISYVGETVKKSVGLTYVSVPYEAATLVVLPVASWDSVGATCDYALVAYGAAPQKGITLFQSHYAQETMFVAEAIELMSRHHMEVATIKDCESAFDAVTTDVSDEELFAELEKMWKVNVRCDNSDDWCD
jgi:20S proteasome alpha/beta subunit